MKLLSLSPASKNGMGMPMLGFGTYQCPLAEAEASVLEALKVGYRHLDTAEVYKNEEGVGKAIKKSGIPRNQIFLTTKVWPGYTGFNQPEKTYAHTIEACNASLKKLGLEYIDLYLIHAPFAATRLDQWRALVDLKKQGKIKHIGVSNYGQVHIEEIEKAGLPLPEANQIEISPICAQKELLSFMKKKGIFPIAYSTLAPLSTWRCDEGQGGEKSSSKRSTHSDLFKKLAAKHNVHEAQVLLRWALQHDIPILPKSTKPDRIGSNFDLFGFELSAEDMKLIDDVDTGKPVAWIAFCGPDFNPINVVTELASTKTK